MTDRGSVTITFGTWNYGPGSKRDLAGLMQVSSIIAVQEAGDRKGPILEVLHDEGWKQITGTEPGQASTPLLYDPLELELLQVSRLLIAHGQYIGPGAGPDRLKDKWLIGGLFRDRRTGRVFWAYSVHYVATQGKPLRRRVALAMTSRIVLRVRALKRAVFVMGDLNAESKSETLRALGASLELAQLEGGQKATHGRRAIDNIAWTPRPWMTVDHTRTEETGSDHRAFLVTFLFQNRKNHPKEQ